jgi:hypothetical protein
MRGIARRQTDLSEPGADSSATHSPAIAGAPPILARARKSAAAARRAPPPPTFDDKRRAAILLRKAFARIEADFSEAYEQCRDDKQRGALSRAHGKAKQAYLRATQELLIDDRNGWKHTRRAFRPDKASAERTLSRLVTAGAVMRILKRLAAIDSQMAVLAS